MAPFQFPRENAAKVTDFARIKAAARVVTQTPEPGTPVLQGMTIEVHAVSYSDVPWQIVDIAAPPPIRNIPIAEIEKVIADDPVLRKAAADGVVVDASAFIQKFTAGLSARGFPMAGLSATDSAALAKSFNQLGFR